MFKSIVDPYIGKYSLIKVNSGVLKTDDVLYNYHRDCDEKIGKLYVMRGSKVEEDVYKRQVLHGVTGGCRQD